VFFVRRWVQIKNNEDDGGKTMTEPTIICPKCKTEIKLTESLVAPLIESTRKQFEQQLA
jgi:hypothetical protein